MAAKTKTKVERPAPEPPKPSQWILPAGPIALATADVSRLTVVENGCDLRRDLHVFLEYVRGRSIKRSVRGNDLPRADAARLAKLLSDPEAVEETRENGRSRWVDFIDDLALRLGLVSYDTQGVYAGYSSQERSFPDSHMAVQETEDAHFLALSLADQERRFVELFASDYRADQFSYSRNEFFATGILGRLDGFTTWGSATGIMPTLEFAPIRRFLLELLALCEADTWLSTEALVAYLKAQHPYFLIPKGRVVERWGQPATRYDNFHECIGSPYGQGEVVPEAAPDAFERVEGRYVERFLEGLPLLMGYVDVAYGENSQPQLYPVRNVLRAFRVKGRLLRSLRGWIAEPTVTVQPNFEIYVQAELYPARILAKLTPLADVVSSDIVTILKLQRAKVAAALIQDERLNVVGLLRDLAGRDLPPNVVRELREWGEHSSKFTLYLNHVLWEGKGDFGSLVVEEIAPGIRLAHSAEALFTGLEQAGLMPLWIKHGEDAFARLPEGAQSVFQSQPVANVAPPAEKPLVELKREVQIILHLPADEVLERVRKALVEARCSIAVDKGLRTITYNRRHESQVAAVIAALEAEYQLRVVDLE